MNLIQTKKDKIFRDVCLQYLLKNYQVAFGWLWTEAHKVCQSVRDGTHDTPRYVKEGIPR